MRKENEAGQTAPPIREIEARVAFYDPLLERLQRVVSEEEPTGENLSAAVEAAEALEAYYTGDLWKLDFAADEAGLLPEALRRGVLSEDGIYNALEAFRDWREDAAREPGFTVSLAAADALPVLFFGVAAVILGLKLHSAVFFIGALVCLLAGAGKVLWKLLLALWGRDVPLLGAQLRVLMPAGFVLMIVGAAIADRSLVRALLHQAVQMPAALFFLLGVIGLVGMILCARKFDRHDVRGNWIEQIINAFAQGCVMIGMLLL